MIRYPLKDSEGRRHRLDIPWMEDEVAALSCLSVVLFSGSIEDR